MKHFSICLLLLAALDGQCADDNERAIERLISYAVDRQMLFVLVECFKPMEENIDSAALGRYLNNIPAWKRAGLLPAITAQQLNSQLNTLGLSIFHRKSDNQLISRHSASTTQIGIQGATELHILDMLREKSRREIPLTKILARLKLMDKPENDGNTADGWKELEPSK